MPLEKLTLVPDQRGYSVTDGEEVLSVEMDGGAGRYRRDVIGASSRARVQWTIGPNEYLYLRAFYRNAVARGSEGFLLDLLVDSPTVTEHTAYFIPGSMQLSSQSGNTFVVRAQLEVRPVAEDTDFDAAVVTFFTEYGDEGQAEMLNLFEQLSNFEVKEHLN